MSDGTKAVALCHLLSLWDRPFAERDRNSTSAAYCASRRRRLPPYPDVETALDFAADWSRAYRIAGPMVRRRFTRPFWKALRDEDGSGTSDLLEPVKELLDERRQIDGQEPQTADAVDKARARMVNESKGQGLPSSSPVRATLTTRTSAGSLSETNSRSLISSPGV